jgi:hypothetical protein
VKDNKRFIYETRPVALSENMVSGSNYRFTVLTPSLIRMEYSKKGGFEDRASQSVFFRDFPKTDFSIFPHTNFPKVLLRVRRAQATPSVRALLSVSIVGFRKWKFWRLQAIRRRAL